MLSGNLAGDSSLRRDFEDLSVSKRLARTVSQKLRKKNYGGGDCDDEGNGRGVSMNCLPLYGRGGGCKVVAEMGDECGDSSARRRSSNSSEEGKAYKLICGNEESGVDCFSYGVREKLWKRNGRKYLEIEDSVQNSRLHIFLPDDLLELCLMRLPLCSLMNARLVCKKWRSLTMLHRFLRMRKERLHRTPWLFVFGVIRDGCVSGEINALDVSLDQWHRVDSDIIKGRFNFNVASAQEDIYVVGGRTSLTQFRRVDGSSYKTHKGVLVFSPVTKSWRKSASMKHARSLPILGTHEVDSDFSIVHCNQHRHERRFARSRIGSVSDVYEDPHRLSLRRQPRNAYDENKSSLVPHRKSYRFSRQRSDQSNARALNRFLLIAVGGFGSWDEPLDSGEIYDSMSNKWTEIQSLPVDFGAVCSGVVCNGIFYAYSETDKLMGYDIDRGFWMGIQTSPFPPRVIDYALKFVSCGGRLFMLSVSWCESDGQIGRRNKAVRKLWELDLMHLTWTEVSVHPDAPMDCNAVYVADNTKIFGIEMFKIFGQVLDFTTVCDASDTESKWSHISRSHMSNGLDYTSCSSKTLAVLYL